MVAQVKRIGIVGSRDYPHPSDIKNYVQNLPNGTVVVSGAARGVDSIAANEARRRGLEIIEFPADWSKGRGAGFARNGKIVEASDEIVAFWDGKSRGTLDTITKARKAGKPVTIIEPSK